jgi:hypothetical protein
MSTRRRAAALLAASLVLLALGPPAGAELVQRDEVRVSFEGKLSPRSLPRRHSAPVRVAVGTRIRTIDGSPPPQLRSIKIAINRHGHLDPTGLPLCTLEEIQPATTRGALAACRDSLVGEGHFAAKLLFNQQAPFPSRGRLYAFNARLHGRPAILAHVYGKEPLPTSYTLPFEIAPGRGAFGTVLSVRLPHVTGSAGRITELSIDLGRNFSDHGRRRSYLSASCAAPPGFGLAGFPLARTTLGFAGGLTLSSTVNRSCRVR